MPSLKVPTIAGTLAWGGVLLGFCGSLLFAPRPSHAEPPTSPAGSAAASAAASSKAALPPLPGAAGSAAPAGSVAAPGASPPPYMYQDQWNPPQDAPRPIQGGPLPAPRPGGYVYEPPPPAPPMHRAPWNSLFLGARVGALFPFGNAYATDSDYYHEYGEEWDGLATGGP